MKQIKLLNLTLENFKGIKHLEVDASGEDVNIYGDNATGKTTVYDAFTWLLFDKDSSNKKDFDIKTLQNGQTLHNLDHSVEANLLVDGQELTLKKSFKEKWTKKRGSVNKEFTGHTTDYAIDGVPSKKKEFTEKVAEIVNEDIFKLLTSPSFFNEQMHWKDRRDLLLEIAGDVEDKEVFATNQDLEKLADILGKRSIEDHKKVIASKRKEINEELDRIPVRIDEINKGLPDTEGLDKQQINDQLQDVQTEIDNKQSQINDIRSGSEINQLKAQISDIDLQIKNVKNEHAQQGQEQLHQLKAKLQEEQSNVSNLQSKVKSQEQQKQLNQDDIKELEQITNDLRSQWHEKNKEEFDSGSNCTCPTCGQDLPEDQIEQAKNDFNRNKASELESIQNKGIDTKKKLENVRSEIDNFDQEIQKLNGQVESKQKQVTKLENQIQEAESNVKPVEDNESYQKLMNDRQALEQQIEQMNKSVEQSVQAVQQEIGSLKEKQSQLQADLSKFDQYEQSQKRIEELEKQEKDLATEFEQLEEELHLTEEFTRTKVNLLEEKINNKFKYARFNLFKTNINGGLEEICETTYNGVPYSSGLNNAARINVGLDIINTLSAHYGVQAPIFVDNAEAVTQLLDIDTQLISLVVSESDKQLRTETKQAEGAA